MLEKLRERQIFPVVLGYLAICWLAIQAAAIISPALDLPTWTVRAVLIASIAGFPAIIVLAWFFNFTSHGIARTGGLSGAMGTSAPLLAGLEQVAIDAPLASIAVLPFEVLGADSGQQVLADGLATEIHATLGQMQRLRVASRRSSFRFRDSTLPVQQVAGELGVRYVLSGSFMQVGERIRVIAELDDGSSGAQIWTRRYEVGLEDVLGVQAEIADGIVGAFGVERERAEIAYARRRPTRSLDAWSLVQRARHYINDYSEKSLREAELLLGRALKLDPDYAIARATLASVLIEKILNGYSRKPEQDRRKALDEVEKARTLEPGDVMVLKLAGMVLGLSGRPDESLQALRACVELAPFDYGAWGYMGWALNARATPVDLEQVHEVMDRLLKAAPEHPGATYWLYHKSVASVLQGRPAVSAELMQRAASIHTPIPWVYMHTANVYGLLGDSVRASDAVRQAAAINPKMTPEHFAAVTAGITGGNAAGRKRIEGLVRAGLLPAEGGTVMPRG